MYKSDYLSLLQAQNDEFSAIFNLEDYKGLLGVIIFCTLFTYQKKKIYFICLSFKFL
jgi:hypothetical protein